MKPKPEAEISLDLTDNEGSLLGLIGRTAPVTAYQLMKMYERSPVSSFNSSTGALYPIINRLKARGFIRAASVKGDGRGTAELSLTEHGLEAVRAWVKQIRPSHVLIEDPLRTKIMSLHHLSPAEQAQWVEDAKKLLGAKLDEVDSYAREVSVPFQEIVKEAVVASLTGRLAWLDKLKRRVRKKK